MKAWLFPFCNCGFKTTLKLFSDYKVEGKENVPPAGPLIFVSNHLSNLDPAIIAAASTRSPRFLAKKELFKLAPMSFLLKSYGAHPLDRGGADIRAIRWAAGHLRQDNASLALFPEGTRQRDGSGMRRGNPGVAQLAAVAGIPIVPMALTGSESLQNMLKVFVPAGHIRVRIGEPFVIKREGDKRPGKQTLQAATDEIMVRIARLLPETYRGYYRELVDQPMVHTASVQASEQGTANTV